MQAAVKWAFWGVALGMSAMMGIALANGGSDDPGAPAEFVKQLSDPDWRVRNHATECLRKGGEAAYRALLTAENDHPEARFRIALLKRELAPVFGNWTHALEAGKEAADSGRHETALGYFLTAARKNENLRQDAWLSELVRRCWLAMPASARNEDARADWELFLCGEYGLLADRHPQSTLREKALFRAGRFEEVLESYPRGHYAPLARYSLTAGHPYFEPSMYLEITDPEREIVQWPEFLRGHPDHPGCDDAAYRLGRAYESTGRHAEAVTWMYRSAELPDGEYAWKGPLRAVYVLDALATEDELRVLAGRGPTVEIRESASLALCARLMRRFDFEAALSACEKFAGEHPESRHTADAAKRAEDLAGVLIPLSRKISGGEGADAAMYDIGRYFYHRVLSLYNASWNGNRVNYFTYEMICLGRTHAFTKPDYFESHNNYIAAAKWFDRLVKEHPESGLLQRALYSAGTAYMKAALLDRFSVFPQGRRGLLRESSERYAALAKQHQGDPLAADAAGMMKVVSGIRVED